MLLKKFEHLPRAVRIGLLAIIDISVALFAIWITLAAENESLTPHLPPYWQMFAIALFMVLGLAVFGVYQTVLRHAGQEVLARVFTASLLSVAVLWMVAKFMGYDTSVVFWLLFLLIWAGVVITYRRLLRIWVLQLMQKHKREKVLIYGAGNAGRQLCAMLQVGSNYSPYAFIDDDAKIIGRKVLGVPVYDFTKIAKLIDKKQINTLLFAIPKLSKVKRNEIFQKLSHLPIKVLSVPSVEDITSGKKQVDDLSDIDIADILGRKEVPAINELLTKQISGKSIMVTGAGGSIGAELCRQIIRLNPTRLVIIDISEIAIYTISHELTQIVTQQQLNTELVSHLGSVSHEKRMMRIMREQQVDVVYHAAAYKHVTIVEENPNEGVLNNIFGTLCLVNAAIAAKVSHFVLISSDKAVRPTSLMGATKRVSEMILQAKHDEQNQTCFSMVRFGNVIGSSGSVVPLFLKQIREGGPVTVTDKNVTRFFMTISEAVQLVIQASAMAAGGDVFLLDMGQPIKIAELAEQLIHLSGRTIKGVDSPEGEIEIVFTGLREGEKLYEELLIDSVSIDTEHPMIKKGEEPFVPWHTLSDYLQQLHLSSKEFDEAKLENIMREIVPDYHKVAVNESY